MEFDNETPVLSLDQNISLRIGETEMGVPVKKEHREERRKGGITRTENTRERSPREIPKREKTTPVYSFGLFLFSRLYTHSILYAIQIINEIIQPKT